MYEKLHFDTKLLACSDMIASASVGRWGAAGPVPALVLGWESCKQLPPSESAGAQLCGTEQVEWDEAGRLGLSLVFKDARKICSSLDLPANTQASGTC